MNRRDTIKTMALASLAIPNLAHLSCMDKSTTQLTNFQLKRNINHSVCRWTYDYLSLDELCQLVLKIGFNAIDLIEPKDFPTLKKYGIYSSLCTGAHISLTEGWNNPIHHKTLIKNYLEFIDLVADAGYASLICFSGNRNGMSDSEGLQNCVVGLKQILPYAEKRNVTIVLELFNSKINHPDYMADSTEWGVNLCKALGSNHFKLLYDIYHMQIMEGDIINTIKSNAAYFHHYHTAGVPGRNEIDSTQELNYPAIMKAIAETGFKGYVAQEFIPKKENKEKALEDAIKLCDI